MISLRIGQDDFTKQTRFPWSREKGERVSKAVVSAWGHVFLSCWALISLTSVSAGSGLGSSRLSAAPQGTVSKSGPL